MKEGPASVSGLFDEELEQSRQLALSYLAARDRSVREVRDKLAQKKCRAEVIDRVIEDLVENRLLDDTAFARRWVQTRQQRRPSGVRRFTDELRRKGIDADVVEQVLTEFGDVGSEEAAVELLRGQAERYRGVEEMRAKRRMYGLLARRGFDSETASRAVDRVWGKMVREPLS